MENRAKIGVRPGTCVALVLPDGPELAVACLGVAAGAVAAPLDPAATVPEIEASFDALEARAVIVPAGGGEAAFHAARGRPARPPGARTAAGVTRRYVRPPRR